MPLCEFYNVKNLAKKEVSLSFSLGQRNGIIFVLVDQMFRKCTVQFVMVRKVLNDDESLDMYM